MELFAQSGPARAGLSLFDGGGNQVAYFTVFPGSSITGLSLSGGKGEPSISLSAMSNAMLNALNRGGVLGGHPASIVLKDSSEEPRIELEALVRHADRDTRDTRPGVEPRAQRPEGAVVGRPGKPGEAEGRDEQPAALIAHGPPGGGRHAPWRHR